MKQQVFHGNNLELLKQYPDNYFDAIVTDPPYGLGKEPNAEEMLQAWITDGYLEVKGSGFMGKEWDAFVPQPIFWKEVFRTLKHGGHVLSFFGTRTYDWGVMAMRLAGFEIRDCIHWIYGSGFPKSHNISKAIDKSFGAEREVVGSKITGTMNNKGGASVIKDGKFDGGQKEISVTISSTDQAKQWEGWGSALKPSNEPIVLARKPLEKGLSIAENVMKWGTGGINIDGCRVGIEMMGGGTMPKIVGSNNFSQRLPNAERIEYNNYSQGRFPANLILSHHAECECKGLKKVKPSNGSGKTTEKGGGFGAGIFGKGESDKILSSMYVDENGQETIEDWTCHEDCPIRIMDEQSGVLNSQGICKSDNKSGWQNKYVGGNEVKPIERKLYLDKGGASRFFYCAKASKSERNKGLIGFEEKPLAFSNQAKAELKRGNVDFDGGDAKGHGNSIRHLKNFHPTVKPVALMQYLVRMITPPNGIVLDPFNGSGTTGIACKLEGFEYVGMELDAEYCKIAQARIDNFVPSDLDYSNETQEEEDNQDKSKGIDNQMSLF
jgi:DNA modification methylase